MRSWEDGKMGDSIEVGMGKAVRKRTKNRRQISEDGGPEVEGEKLVRWEAVSKSEWGILEAERGDRKGIKKMGR